MTVNTNKQKNVYLYFISLLIVTIPFWILGSVTKIHGLPFDMQLNVLLVLAIPLVSSYFIVKTYGRAGLKQALREILPGRVRYQDTLIAFLTMPLVAMIAFLVLRASVPFDGWSISIGILPLYFVVYYIAAACEEMGWTWYATPLIARRHSILLTGIIIGVMWSLVHIWPWYQQSGLWFMVGMIIITIINRLIMTWLYLKRGKSLMLVIVYHAMINTTFTVFYANSPYANPFVYALMLVALIAIALTTHKIIKPRPKPSQA